MNEIFGSISVDSLPTGYGDEAQISHPTGGTVGPSGFADAMQVAGQGSVSSFGADANMHGLPSGEYGKLFDKDRRTKRREDREGSGFLGMKTKEEREESGGSGFLGMQTREEKGKNPIFGSGGLFGGKKDSGGTTAEFVTFKGQGGYTWDYYPGQKAIVASGPENVGQSFAKGTSAYAQVEKEWKAAGSPMPKTTGGKRGGKKPISGQRAANIGSGLGSFFNQAAPALVGLFGPKQAVDMSIPGDSGGGSYDLTPSGPSPIAIGLGVVGVLAFLGIGYALVNRSGGDDD